MNKFARGTRWLAALACASMLTGCYTLSYRVDDVYGPPTSKMNVVRSFKTEVRHHHLINGLLTIEGEKAIQDAIESEVERVRGRGVANVRVRHEKSLVDGVLASVTNGLYSPTTTTIEGDVVR